MKAADQFRPADVTKWGITALVIWGVAIMGANFSGLVPPNVYGALHASQLEGSTLNQLRAQVASLQQDSAQLRRENTQLQQRFSLNEDSTNSITKRVGALEVSVPKIVERQLASVQPPIDDTKTGSIDTPTTFEVEGGSVSVRQRPLIPESPEVTFKPLPFANVMPLELKSDGSALGIGLGAPVAADKALRQWQDIVAKAGIMLMGLSPVLADVDGSSDKLIVAGPLSDRASAQELCERLSSKNLACQPLPYSGGPIAPAN